LSDRGAILQIATIFGVGGTFSDVPHFVMYGTLRVLGPWPVPFLPQVLFTLVRGREILRTSP
jgi:hypothetical protein